MAKWLKLTGIGIAVLMAPPVYGQATGPDDDADRAGDLADRLTNQFDSFEAPAIGFDEAAPKMWELKFSLPLTYNTNATQVTNGELDSFHATPAVSLSRKWAISDSARFTLGASTIIDAYTAVPAADQSILGAVANLDFGNPDTGLAVSLGYRPLVIYSGQYDNHVVTLHRLAIGIGRNLLLNEADKISLRASFERREATSPAAEQFRYAIEGSFTGQISAKSSWQLGAQFTRSDYTGGTNDGRNDDKLVASAGLGTKLSTNVALALGMEFSRNWSDFVGKDYSVFDVGPKVTLQSAF